MSGFQILRDTNLEQFEEMLEEIREASYADEDCDYKTYTKKEIKSLARQAAAKILNQIIDGSLAVENGKELVDTMYAVKTVTEL